MATSIIISICLLLLFAYIFDISSALTKIPSVILLLLLGWVVKQVTSILNFHIPNLNLLLPILGTIGLILIVLEGSLELEINKSKIPVIKKSLFIALVPMLSLSLILSILFYYFGQVSFKTAIINAIPFCVISSAIAIPSVKNLPEYDKEFTIYESSFSDIFGVLLFNFITINHTINFYSFGSFTLNLLLIIVISLVSVLGLSYLLSRLKHQITFTPIILIVILIYHISKLLHLPGLIFILVFGLFLGNLDDLKRFRGIQKLSSEKLKNEIYKFKEFTIEATFIVRALFFILFGFLMDTKTLFNHESLPWAICIMFLIILIRWLALKYSKLSSSPLLLIAPRGLISVLLFLSIEPHHSISFVNNSLIIQIIIISVLIMMFGLITAKKE